MNRDLYFKGQHDDENFVCFFRHHWIVLVKEIIYFVGFLLMAVLLLLNFDVMREAVRTGGTEMRLLFATIFVAMTIVPHRVFIKVFNYFMSVGIVTDVRVIDCARTVFFHDTFDAIDLAQIQNMEQLREGVVANLFGYGDVKIFLNGVSVVKTFHTVPNVKFHFRCFNRCMEHRKRKLSVVKDYQQRPVPIEEPV